LSGERDVEFPTVDDDVDEVGVHEFPWGFVLHWNASRRAAVLFLVLVALASAWLTSGPTKTGPAYTAFEARRSAWHRQCDEFAGKTTNEINAIYKPGFADERVRTCKQDLEELTAYAKQQGWN
jgi:hypothetical protein